MNGRAATSSEVEQQTPRGADPAPARAVETEIEAGGRFSALFIWLAVLFFAAANSVVLLLFQIGQANPVDGRNPISFCNVLFVGNLVACAGMWIFYRKEWTKENLRALRWFDWAGLFFLAVLTGALIPSLVFLALENSNVTNVVFVQRIEPILLMMLPLVFMGDRLEFWPAMGAVVALIGVAVAFWLDSAGRGGVTFGKGELFAASGALLTALSTFLSRIWLKNVPLGIFAVVRTGFGAVFFFVVAIYLFGFEHFEDVLEPLLWQWMLVYGLIIVMGGQYFWFTGIKNARTSEVSLISSFTPIAGVVFAFLLLGEQPSSGMLVGGAVIVAGIFAGQLGNILAKRAKARRMTENEALQADCRAGFKGV